MVRPCYDPKTGEFKGLQVTISFLVLRHSPEEVFFDYGYDCEKSKILYSHYRRRIPNSFSGTKFNRHGTTIESGQAEGNFSNIFFFLAITDRSEKINQYLNNISIFPIEITQSQLNNWVGTKFDPFKLDLFALEKNSMTDAVVKRLKHMNDISNSNIVRDGNGLLSKKEVEVPVDWIGEKKNGFHLRNLKSPINFCFRDPL